MTPEQAWALAIVAGSAIAVMAVLLVRMHSGLKAARRRLSESQEARIRLAEEFYRVLYRLKQMVAERRRGGYQ